MTNVDDNAGELTSFLHLTGKRPLLLILLAGIAGAIGVFLALGEPAQWQARYVVNGQRVADDALQPAELNIFVEEIATTMKLPVVIDLVEERTGYVEEIDYEITVNQSGSSVALIDVNVVADEPEIAQAVAVETAVAGLEVTLDKTRQSVQATVDQLEDAIDQNTIRIAELTGDAGGINPTLAYDSAAQAVLDRRAFLANPPTTQETDEDGNVTTVQVPEPEPPLAELEAEVDRLAPLEREHTQLVNENNEFALRLSERRASVRDADGSIAALATERDAPNIIDEVVTEETSRLSGLLTGLLLFAVPATLLFIAACWVYDLLRPKTPEPAGVAVEAHGELDAATSRALPEASVTPLVVVDEGDEEHIIDVESTETATATADDDELDDDDRTDVDDDLDNDLHGGDDLDDEDDTPDSTRSNRWGRDASSKAG